MAMRNNKTQCFKCNKNKITYSCAGCSKEFCLMDLTEHRQILNNELNHITNEYKKFTQTINEQRQNPYNHSLIKQIDQWEVDSIEKIKQKAHNCRKIAIESLQTYINTVEMKFNDLNEQIKQIHKENEYNEINLYYLRNELIKIRQELNNPSNMSIQKNGQSFTNDVSIVLSKEPKFSKYKQNAITVAGGYGQGPQLYQLNRPTGIFIDKEKNIFIADYWNDRIIAWKYNAKERKIIAGGNGYGNGMNQLNNPTDVIIDQQNHSIIIADRGNRRVIQWLNQKQQVFIGNIDCFGLAIDKFGFLYVSNCKKNEVRRWKMGEYNNEGILVAGGNRKGDRLNQLNFPTFIFVDEDQSIYVSDRYNHRVMKWRKDTKKGTIVAGGNGKGRNRNQLSSPAGVVVGDSGQIYVADWWNHRVMRWCEGKDDGEIIVGGNGYGNQSNQLNRPFDLSFDDEGNLYVVDCGNHRIQKFEIILC
ncbi:unnamed protein product [Adineta steineri]|uniref:Uncharacterized protein n=1 Tax=Adineta steineri TaxID=433720 RepID=A0A815JXV1_9BILA|nr:unnamed protein product [Adineta steineri]